MPSTDWNIRLVNARQAQRMLPRKPDTDDEIDWRGVEIALVDTGYTTHPAFGPWEAGSSPVLQVGRGKNFVESDPPNNRPRDPLNYSGQPGHGTRVGSVMCGNLPGLMVGIAPGVPTIPYRVTNTTVLASTATRERVAAAIRDAVDRNGCEVISISMGFPLLDLFGQRELGKAVDHAYDNGVIVVGAGGQVIDKVVYPGKFFRSIGVGGVTPDWKVWFEYDRAELDFIDVWAPGGDVYRANSILVDGPGHLPRPPPRRRHVLRRRSRQRSRRDVDRRPPRRPRRHLSGTLAKDRSVSRGSYAEPHHRPRQLRPCRRNRHS